MTYAAGSTVLLVAGNKVQWNGSVGHAQTISIATNTSLLYRMCSIHFITVKSIYLKNECATGRSIVMGLHTVLRHHVT